MSYGSRTQLPSTSRTARGRGRGQRTPYSPHVMNNSGMAEGEADQGGDDSYGGGGEERRESAGERRMQRSAGQGAHYVLAPDPSKNSKLKQGATREEAEYARYKEEQRELTAQRLVSQPPGLVGGVEKTLSEIKALREKQEKKQQKEARFAEVKKRERREKYRQTEREKEDAKLRQMKQTQREKAVRVAANKEESQRQEREELRRKRLAHFDQT